MLTLIKLFVLYAFVFLINIWQRLMTFCLNGIDQCIPLMSSMYLSDSWILERQTPYVEKTLLNVQRKMQSLRGENLPSSHAQSSTSVDQLVAGIAHEMNNPLGFVSSNLMTLQEYAVSLKRILEQQQHLMSRFTGQRTLSTIEIMALHDDAELNFILSDLEGLIGDSIKGVSRIAKVVENLSTESRVDNFNASDEDLNQLLDQTIDLIATQQDRNFRIVKEYDALSNVKVDAEKIHQVFLALISNACQAIDGANKSNAEIVLRTTQLKQYVRIDVIDNGCGIPEEKLGTIFEPFYTTRNVGEGVGLGLHMAQNVIENHGGALRVSSKVGDGTILTVILPINDSMSSVSGQPMDIRLSL